MKDNLELLLDYSKEKHLGKIITTEKKIDIIPIFSESWMSNNFDLPNIAISYLLDSYFMLDSGRPDLGFREIWTSFNNLYNQLVYKDIDYFNQKYINVSDNQAISYFLELVENKNDNDIKNVFNLYKNKIPYKQFSFLANIILKGLVFEKSSLPEKYKKIINYKNIRNSTYNFIKIIDNTYWKKYLEISSCSIKKWILCFDIDKKHKDKSLKLVKSLAWKIEELFLKWETIFYDWDEKHLCNIENDYIAMKFLLKGLLYTTRNTSLHWNKISRSNSPTANKWTLESSIYLYFLSHFFLSIIFYLLEYIKKDELLSINNKNLEKLTKTLWT